MHIKKITVENFRNEGIDIIWDLNPDVNILVGKNGCGKTTLLKNIEDCLKEGGTYRLFQVTRELNLSSSSIVEFLHKQGFEEVVEDLNAKISQEQYEILVKRFAPDRLKDTTHISRRIVEDKFSHNIQLALNESLKSLQNTNDIRLHNFDIPVETYLKDYDMSENQQFSALDIDLQKRKLQFIIFQSEQRKKLDNFYFGKIKLNAEERKQMELELNTNHQRIETFIEIVNAMFADTEKTIDLDELSFKLKNDVTIQLHELSSGEKQVIHILLTAVLQNHKETSLLLDEPEISLDTSWQRELLKNIRIINPNCQLIVVTHSPAIIGRGWMGHFKRWEEIIQETKFQEKKSQETLANLLPDIIEKETVQETKTNLEAIPKLKVAGKVDLESFRRKTPRKK